MSTTNSIAIIGAGHGGVQLAHSLRTEGWEGRIDLISAEADMPYQRPPLTKAYLQDKVAQDKILLRPEAFYEQQGINIHLNQEVVHIDKHTRLVVTASGAEFSYDKLCIATGTRPRLLTELPGSEDSGCDASGIHYLRTKQDIDAIVRAVPMASHIVLVGGGYIGLEAAASLNQMGKNVTVIEAADRILQRVTSPLVSDFLRTEHTNRGVRILEATQVVCYEKNDAGQITAVRLANGEALPCELAIVGIGVIVHDKLAQQLDLQWNNGIAINAYCRTSIEDIWAIGDCASFYSSLYDRTIRLESIPNAMEQARVAAANMCGKQEKSYDPTPWFWSDQYEHKLQMAGLSSGYDTAEVVQPEGELNVQPTQPALAVHYFRDGKLLAADTVNLPKIFAEAKSQLALPPK